MNNKLQGLVWVTGLPGAGKTTFSTRLKEILISKKINCILLDGDEMRAVFDNLSYDLSSRKALALQYSKLCRLLTTQNQLVVCSTVSMFDDVRTWNRANISPYTEVYLEVAVDVLVKRDQKQLYSQADQHEQVVPGVNQQIEQPQNPDFHFENMTMDEMDNNVNELILHLEKTSRHRMR